MSTESGELRELEGAIDQAPTKSSWLSVGAAILITFLAWPLGNLTPRIGLDPSWNAGLHMGAERGLVFGKDIVFSYGPFGFLGVTTFWEGWTGVLAFLYAMVVAFGLAFTLIYLGRRSFGLPVAMLVGYGALLLTVFDPAETAVVVIFLWCLSWASSDPPSHARRTLILGGGVISAFQLLIKFNTGVVCLAIVAIALWVCSSRKAQDELNLVGTFALSLVGLWVATGSSVSKLPQFIHRSLQVASGYSAAMATNVQHSITYAAAAAVTIGVLLVVILARRGRESRPGLAVFLMMFVMTYAVFRHAFVLDEPFHSEQYFAYSAVVLVGFRWLRSSRFVAAGVCMLALIVAAFRPVTNRSVAHEVAARPGRAIDQLQLLLEGSQRQALVAGARREMQSQLAVDASTLQLLEGHQVAIDPDEISVAWAYDLSWHPVPVFQSYSAYTSGLDQLNAMNLASKSGPDAILRSGPLTGFNRRYPLFESPSYELALLCNFQQVHVTNRWQLLERVSNRCGGPVLLGTARSKGSGIVAIPRPGPGQIVYATLQVHTSWFDRLMTALFKPPILPDIKLDRRSYRFLTAHASNPHVLCIPRFIEAAEYGGGVCPKTLSIEGVGSYDVIFYSIAISAGPAPGFAASHAERLNAAHH